MSGKTPWANAGVIPAGRPLPQQLVAMAQLFLPHRHQLPLPWLLPHLLQHLLQHPHLLLLLPAR